MVEQRISSVFWPLWRYRSVECMNEWMNSCSRDRALPQSFNEPVKGKQKGWDMETFRQIKGKAYVLGELTWSGDKCWSSCLGMRLPWCNSVVGRQCDKVGDDSLHIEENHVTSWETLRFFSQLMDRVFLGGFRWSHRCFVRGINVFVVQSTGRQIAGEDWWWLSAAFKSLSVSMHFCVKP